MTKAPGAFLSRFPPHPALRHSVLAPKKAPPPKWSSGVVKERMGCKILHILHRTARAEEKEWRVARACNYRGKQNARGHQAHGQRGDTEVFAVRRRVPVLAGNLAPPGDPTSFLPVSRNVTVTYSLRILTSFSRPLRAKWRAFHLLIVFCAWRKMDSRAFRSWVTLDPPM